MECSVLSKPTSPNRSFTVYNTVLCLGSLPGTMAAHSLMNAIKAKCSPDEAAQILRELPNKFPNGEDNGQTVWKCAMLCVGDCLMCLKQCGKGAGRGFLLGGPHSVSCLERVVGDFFGGGRGRGGE